MNTQPAITIGAITSIVAALLVFLREFGVPITDGQQQAIQVLVAVVAPVVAGLIIRGFVWSPESAKHAAAESYAAGVSDKDAPIVLG